MAMPFAALLLNGKKTLETRNSNIFHKLQGQKCLIRIGHRDWDDDFWTTVVDDPAAGDFLNTNFKRGDVAGVVDVGPTRPTTDFADDLGWSEVELRAMATQARCGTFATVVANATWFPRGVKGPGKPSIYHTSVPSAFVTALQDPKKSDEPTTPRVTENPTSR